MTLITALIISTVAAWYSIVGLVAIFSASPIPVIIMGAVLESGKIITVVWLHYYWEVAPKAIRIYLITSVIILMLITSMGIFGFLSKAHIEQSNNVLTIDSKLQNINYQLSIQQKRIERIDQSMFQLDSAIDKYIELGALTKGLAQRNQQKEERDELLKLRNSTQQIIDNYNIEKLSLQQQRSEFEIEVGPLKYIAALIYGENHELFLENAVRWVIILLIFVFDPLAVILLISSQYTFQKISLPRKSIKPNTPKPKLTRKKIKASVHSGANAEVVRSKKMLENNDNIAIINNEGLI